MHKEIYIKYAKDKEHRALWLIKCSKVGSTKHSHVWVPCLIKHGNVGEVIHLPDLSCVETMQQVHFYSISAASE